MHPSPVSEGLGLAVGLESKILAGDHDQDLIQRQGYGNMHTYVLTKTHRSSSGPFLHESWMIAHFTFTVVVVVVDCHRTARLIGSLFCLPSDTGYVISKTFFPANLLAWYGRN